MLQSSPVKPSAPAAAHAHAGAAASSVVTDPTLRLMAAAAAAAGGGGGGGRPGRPGPAPTVSDVAGVSPGAARPPSSELYASLLYSHHHHQQQQQQQQLDRATALMLQHQFSMSQPHRAAVQQSHAASHQPPPPPQAHTGTGHFAMPPYSPTSHQLHAAAAFESYSQSLATLSQLSQRLQLHARLPAVPHHAAIGAVDPYLAAAAAAAARGGRAGSPAAACKRPAPDSPPAPPPRRSPGTPPPPPRSPVISERQTPPCSGTGAQSTHAATNPYDFISDPPSDLSPPGYDLKLPAHHHHHHHHHRRHSSHQQQQQQRKPGVGGDVCRDENHNAFMHSTAAAVHQLQHPRDNRPELATSMHVPRADRRQLAAPGNGSDVSGESGSRAEARRRAGGRADFSHGSMVQLSDGRVKRIEDMRTEDFVVSCGRGGGVTSSRPMTSSAGAVTSSSGLVLVSSRVVHIRLSHDTSTAVLGFVVDDYRHSTPVYTHTTHFSWLLINASALSSCRPTRRFGS